MSTRANPVVIMVLMHYHCRPITYPDDSQAAQDAHTWLLRHKLIEEDPSEKNLDIFRTTPRGRAWVQGLLNTELPIRGWKCGDGEFIIDNDS